MKKQSRTFQNPSKMLSEVAQETLGAYGFAVSIENDIPISMMLSQQNETDWQFIRRVTNRLDFLFLQTVNQERSASASVWCPLGKRRLPEAFAFEQTEKNITDYLRHKECIGAGGICL